MPLGPPKGLRLLWQPCSCAAKDSPPLEQPTAPNEIGKGGPGFASKARGLHGCHKVSGSLFVPAHPYSRFIVWNDLDEKGLDFAIRA